MNPTPTVQDLIAGIEGGDRRSLAQGITLVESSRASDLPRKVEFLDRVTQAIPVANESVRLGISGTPGVGKSTLIEAVGMKLIGQGHRVAVLAVDPSSARTGGSILGDKTRMPQLAVHQNAFVRPSPAGGGLGGITGTTAAAVAVCELAGYDIVLVETVGVGQSETAVADVTDLFLLLHSPGGGDELQGIKRGVMELADHVAVTKADGDLLAAANRAAAELRSALHLMRPKPGRGMTPVSLCSAVDGSGLDELLNEISEQHAHLKSVGELATVRRAQRHMQFQRAVEEGIRRRTVDDDRVQSTTERMERLLDDGELSPLGAANHVLVASSTSPAVSQTELNAVTLIVGDMARSVAFYRSLGFPVVFGGPDSAFTTLQHGANFLNLQLKEHGPEIVPWGRPIFFVPDPDAVFGAATEAGHEPHSAPTDASWGERYFHISDPDGHELSFARRL